MLVLDCSLTMTWLFRDEANELADQVLDQLDRIDAHVPAIWPLEVANVIAIGERRQRVNLAQATTFIRALACLRIHVDEEAPRRAFHDILHLARMQSLTAYDASYIELALRLGAPLATLDDRLSRVAEQVGIALLRSH